VDTAGCDAICLMPGVRGTSGAVGDSPATFFANGSPGCERAIQRAQAAERDPAAALYSRAFALLCSQHSRSMRRICGERNHERFNCEPLASSAHSRRQWSQQVQRLSALLGQALAGLDCRSLQRGQRGVLGRRERAGVSIVTRTGVNGDQSAFETHERFIPRYRPGTWYSAPNICSSLPWWQLSCQRLKDDIILAHPHQLIHST